MIKSSLKTLALFVLFLTARAWGASSEFSADLAALSETAAELEALVNNKFLDPRGVLYGQLDENWHPFVDPLPATEEVMTIPGAKCSEAGIRNYENTGMVQGEFLAAMCAKYRVTGDPAALSAAARTYRGIREVYRMSTEFGGSGYYCKPWGGVAQPETSSDQYIYTLYGLDQYYPLATSVERAEIAAMITAMAEYWPRHQYRQQFLGKMLNWQECRFISFMQLGVKYGASEVCRQELKRLLQSAAVTNDVPFKGSLRFGMKARPDGLEVQSVNAENAMSAWLSVYARLEAEPQDAYARRLLPELFDFARTSLAPEGNGYRFLIRAANGEWQELPMEQTKIFSENKTPPWNWTLCEFSGPIRLGGQAAALGTAAMALMAPHLPDAAAWCREYAATRLKRIAQGHLTWYEDPHGLLPPRLKWVPRVHSGDAVAGWLLAYWTLRESAKAVPPSVAGRAEWMRGKYGVMVHWLYPGEGDIDRWTDNFDVAEFLRDFECTGAEWLIFTVGQCRGAYASPNAALERYCGPGHASRRDLLAEIARGVRGLGKRFIVYSAIDFENDGCTNHAMQVGLKWQPQGVDRRTFEARWSEVLSIWSRRLGESVDGWWLDGCTAKEYPAGVDWQKWLSACRAGNRKAAVAFNGGINNFAEPWGCSDYTAGETLLIDSAERVVSELKQIPGHTRHYLLPLDGYWGAYWPWPRGEWARTEQLQKERPELFDEAYLRRLQQAGEFPKPIYSPERLRTFFEASRKAQAGVTFNVGIGPTGRLNPASLCLLRQLNSASSSALSETVDLEAESARLESELERTFLDTNGVLRCSTGASDVTIWESKGPYENVGIVNGTFLQAMCAKYAVTGKPADLAKAQRTYRAIAKVYELSQAMGEGYFCKPWGWRCQDETSSDQFVYAMLGMDAYYPYATAAERKEIAERIPKMARWWISRNYRYQYLGRPLNWQRCRFPTFAALAEKYARNGEFAAELKRLLDDPAVTNDLPYRCAIDRGAFPTPDGKRYYRVSPGTAEIGFNAVSAVLESDPENPYANRVMRSCYDLAKNCIIPDGSAYLYMDRLSDGTWCEMPASAAFMEKPSAEDPRYNSPFLRFHGPVRSSAEGAVLGMVLISEYYPPAAEWVKQNAESIFAQMARRGFERTDPWGVQPAEVVAMVQRFPKHCESIVAWLQGYWTYRRLQQESAAKSVQAKKPWSMFERRLGMFVHWGIYSVGGWHEQERLRKARSREEYEKYAEKFTAENFDAEKLVEAAETLGAEYIVFTTKHHDGFCMWDTRTTDFNIMNTPARRDVVKELAQACQRRGMKLGFYYSNPDWHHPNAYNPKSTHQLSAPNPGDVPDLGKYVAYVKAQITELMTNYGEICCLFWDIPTHVDAPELNELVRKLQPHIKIDDRGWGSKGDYSTPERGIPEGSAFTRPTEACDSVGAQSWGYRINEDYHTLGYLTRAIDRTLSMGGNFLLNVGPKPDGSLPEQSLRLLEEVGGWYAKVRESYQGAETVTNLVKGAMVTRRGTVLYLHYPKGLVANGLDLAPLNQLPLRARVLNDGTELEATVEYLPSSYWGDRRPTTHLSGLHADQLDNESVIIRLDMRLVPGA